MSETLRDAFTRLDGDSRVNSLIELVKLCSYQEQLNFNERLQQYLHKDFISFLPEKLVKKVLSYLSVSDAINCTLVSKNWSKVVGDCDSYWGQQANCIGLSDAFIAGQLKMGSCKRAKDLCVSAVAHQNYIQSLTSRALLITKNPAGDDFCYKYVGNGIALRYKELNGQAQVFIERIISHHSVVEIATFEVKSFSGRIKWAAASEDYVLWKGLDGGWRGYDTTSLSSELEEWVDEPLPQGFSSISFCHHCHLIVVLSEAEDDIEVWDLQVIKLGKGKPTVRKMVYPLPLERVQNVWEKKRHFLGGDVTVLSESHEKDITGFCHSHQIFLQIDSKLVLHRLKAVPVSERVLLIHHLLPDAKLSQPLHVFSPRTKEEPLDYLMGMGLQVSKGRPFFCYSSDYTRIGLLHESYFYMWALDGVEMNSCVDLIQYDLPTDCRCVALGSVYAVLASDSHGTCYVVTVRTGKLLYQCTASSSTFNPEAQHLVRFKFSAPLDQQWLSGFTYADFWSIALVLDQFNNSVQEHEMKALVGMQSCPGVNCSK